MAATIHNNTHSALLASHHKNPISSCGLRLQVPVCFSSDKVYWNSCLIICDIHTLTSGKKYIILIFYFASWAMVLRISSIFNMHKGVWAICSLTVTWDKNALGMGKKNTTITSFKKLIPLPPKYVRKRQVRVYRECLQINTRQDHKDLLYSACYIMPRSKGGHWTVYLYLTFGLLVSLRSTNTEDGTWLNSNCFYFGFPSFPVVFCVLI